MKHYWVYIMTNWNNKVLYTGVTNNIVLKVGQHKLKLVRGFTQKYNISKLVYSEEFRDIKEAIAAEKKIKGWIRAKKNKLIESINPEWNDLFEEIRINNGSI